MCHSPRRTTAACAAFIALAISGPAAAGVIDFTQVARTGVTSVPGSAETFIFLGDSSAVTDGSNVVFAGATPSGIYIFDVAGNSLSRVVDVNSAVPSSRPVRFRGFDGQTFISNGVVGVEGFVEFTNSNSPSAFEIAMTFAGSGAAPAVIADTVEIIDIDFVNQPAIDGSGAVAFDAELDNGVPAVLTNASGALTVVVDENTAVPGLPRYSFVDFDSNVSFDGSIGISADIDDGSSPNNPETLLLRATPDGMLTVIADTLSTVSPSNGEAFDELDELSVDGADVAFAGDTPSGFEGIYADFGGGLITIADENTAVPGEIGVLFSSFDDDRVSLDDGRVLFEGMFSTGAGIFFWENGVLEAVLKEGDLLDGLLVADVDLSFDGALHGDRLAFYVEFDDSSRAIYTARFGDAAVSVPGVLGLLVIGLAGLGGVRATKHRVA